MEKRTWLRLIRRAVQRTGLKEQLEEDEEEEGADDETDGVPSRRSTRISAAQAIEPWLQDCPDTLDVYVAQRDFEEAVNLVDKAQQALGGV